MCVSVLMALSTWWKPPMGGRMPDAAGNRLYWIRAGGYDGRGWETLLGIRGIHDRGDA